MVLVVRGPMIRSTRILVADLTPEDREQRRAYFRQKQREHRARVAADPVRRAYHLRRERMRHAARRQEG